MKPWSRLLINLSLGTVIITILGLYFWQLFARPYLTSPLPVGGDFFTFVTFAEFFHDHLPFPATGWLPFWNAGQPLIGGYPSLTFYLVYPLTQITDTATALMIYSLIFFSLFLLCCLALFFSLSRNWLFAGCCVFILLITRATYYQLATAGLISAASAQFYLPLSLIFTLAYLRQPKFKLIFLSGLITGVGLLHHSPTVLLTTLLPQILVLSLFAKSRRVSILLFLLPAVVVGSPSIYTTLLQSFLGSGLDGCSDPQCWGIYPKHLGVWLNLLAPGLVVLLLPSLMLKKTNALFLPILTLLAIPIGYALLAHLHLINNLANVVFPIRMFWVAVVILLCLASSLFGRLHHNPLVLHLVSIVITASIAIYIYVNPFAVLWDRTATVPQNSAEYTLSKYQTLPLKDLIPDWIDLSSTTYRLDSFQPGIVAWWNNVTEVPSVRGYANHPVGSQRDWQYFLQSFTRTPTDPSSPYTLNAALFLLDHYGIGYIEDTVTSYPTSLTSDPKLIAQTVKLRESIWHQLQLSATSPIVTATNATPILFVGNTTDYQLFVRSLAPTGLTSRTLIPVRGPQTFDQITDTELSIFKHLFIYNSSIKNSTRLLAFLNAGGQVILDTTTAFTGDYLPVTTLTPTAITDWSAPNTAGFAPLTYEGGPWKVLHGSNLANDSTALLAQGPDKILISSRRFSSGQLILSTINFPFHLVSTRNWPETQLFSSLITSLLPTTVPPAKVNVSRPRPNQILVSGQFSGIYFKENYHPGWHSSSGSIYPAGLDFMYLPTRDKKVVITFSGNLTTWLLSLLPLIGIVGSVLTLLVPTHHHARLLKHVHRHTLHRFSKWFDSE